MSGIKGQSSKVYADYSGMVQRGKEELETSVQS